MKHLLESPLSSIQDQKIAIQNKLGSTEEIAHQVWVALTWMNMFSEIQLIATHKSMFDAFCSLLQEKLVYAPGERDMVIMHHIFGIEWKDGKKSFSSFHAKKARGLMASFVITNQLKQPEQLKNFDIEGYRFSKQESTETNYVFIRNGLPH